MISSAHNAKIQLARALISRPKERREQASFVAEGVRLVEEAANAGWPFRFGLYTEELNERGKRLVETLQARNIPCEEVSQDLFNAISDTHTSQGLLAVLNLPHSSPSKDLSFALILDAIRDPGNLGTLLRTAAAAGVETVFLPPETTDAFAPKVVRAGMGAHFHLPIQSLSWEEIQAQVHGLAVYLAETEAKLSCWEADLKAPLALIIGGEAEGASQPARELATDFISIPMQAKAESLNAAMAGAILMFEVVRQRSQK
jgi:RNA methyltransferase, TrmH family